MVFHVETLQQPILHQNHQLVTEQQFSGLPEMLGSSCNLLSLIAADVFCELRRKRRNGLAKQSKEHAPKASEAFDSSMRSNLFADIQAKAGATKHVKSACQVRQVRSVMNFEPMQLTRPAFLTPNSARSSSEGVAPRSRSKHLRTVDV